jgi:glutamine synthetase
LIIIFPAGSAAHAHISVHTPGRTPVASSHANLNKIEASFLAGVLEHLSALALLSLPHVSSYKRMVDGVWSGGTYVSWGIEHKETPVRLCNPHSPSSRNFEFKTLDGTANPYLALSGMLMAGLSGIVELKELTMKDCSGEASPALLDEDERAKLGIKERFPLSWEDAYSKFKESEIVDRFFGNEFKRKYLSIQKA